MKVFLYIGLCALLLASACKEDAVGETVEASICSVNPTERPYFQRPAAEQTMDEILENIIECYPTEDRARARAENIGAGASEDIKTLLTSLYLNKVPEQVELQALGPEALNNLLRPADDNYNHTTILTEATRVRNYRWVVALLEAGADPNGSGSLMAYVASREIFNPSSPWFHTFQDGAPAIPFLEAYLKYGGNLDTTEDGDYGTGPLIGAPFNNLAAKIFLLEQGADPWLIKNEPKPRNFDLTMMGTYVGAWAADYNEVMYIFVKRGLYVAPPQEVYKPVVHARFLDALVELHDASGPERRHRLWTLQKVMHAFIEIGALTPSDEMMEMLQANPIPDSEGGWILKEGQLYQPYDDPRRGASLGTEVW